MCIGAFFLLHISNILSIAFAMQRTLLMQRRQEGDFKKSSHILGN